MTRLWTLSRTGDGKGNGPAPLPPPASPPAQAELVTVPPNGFADRYRSRPVRPITQLGVRALLWGGVVLGALGGIAGLLRPPAQPRPPETASHTAVDVPAPVSGVAEMVVREWLTATEDDDEQLAQLFVAPPSVDGVTANDMRVGQIDTIAGRPLQEGYWAVTVRAEVSEPVPVDVPVGDPAAGEDGPLAAGPTEERQTSVWYLEVGIVGDVDTGLAALTTPALLPGPPEGSTGWRPSIDNPQRPESDDPTARTVDGFFDALLAGGGDPERYVAPGVVVRAADPPPFADTEVVSLAVDQLEEGTYRVLANVWGRTPGGIRQQLSYELVVAERVDRLEITRFSGAPTMVAGSADPPRRDGSQPSTSGSSPPETSGDTITDP